MRVVALVGRREVEKRRHERERDAAGDERPVLRKRLQIPRGSLPFLPEPAHQIEYSPETRIPNHVF